MNLYINWKLAIFSIFFTVAFTYLSVWQYKRADEKVASIAQDEIRRHQPGVGLNELPTNVAEQDRLPVTLSGRFDAEKVFLLDNIVLNGIVGFEVLLPFIDDGGETVLVNRGFVPMGATRQILPLIPDIHGLKQVINGQLYVTKSWGPKDNFMSRESSPFIVQSYDPSRFEAVLETKLFPHILRLAEKEQDALPRYWPVVVMLPERHIGYAITWLLMAAAVVIAFAAFTYQTNNVNNKDVT